MNKLIIFFCVLNYCLYSQNQQNKEIYKEIPEKFLNHPELEKSTYKSLTSESKYEMIHLRTKYSKTFLNTNTTKTTIHSSTPMHYEDSNGFLRTIDYQLIKKGNNIQYPSQDAFVSFNLNSNDLTLTENSNSIKFKNEVNILFYNSEQSLIKKINPKQKNPKVNSKNNLLFENIFDNIDKKLTFYNQAIKSDYILKSPQIIPAGSDKLILEEFIEIPQNLRLQPKTNSKGKINQIFVLDNQGKEEFGIYQPIITDSSILNPKLKNQSEVYEAEYRLEQINNQTYKISTIIDTKWLLSSERVYPIIIDPVVTIQNTNVVNSCFFPNYQQNSLQVNVPSGETIIYTDINYDFIATNSSGAWMSEQRSFVSSVNGQTSVLSGSTDTTGTFTYNINGTSIANSTSTGSVNFTFNFSRTWGGTDCDATFQFVNRREIAVTHGTVIYGNGPIYINEYSASNRTHNDGFGRTEDWIEIFNADPVNYFNLSNYYLRASLKTHFFI